MNTTQQLAAKLNSNSMSINIPKTLTPSEIEQMIDAGLIVDMGCGYEATDYARDVIDGRN